MKSHWSCGGVADSFENNKYIHTIAIGGIEASSGVKN